VERGEKGVSAHLVLPGNLVQRVPGRSREQSGLGATRRVQATAAGCGSAWCVCGAAHSVGTKSLHAGHHSDEKKRTTIFPRSTSAAATCVPSFVSSVMPARLISITRAHLITRRRDRPTQPLENSAAKAKALCTLTAVRLLGTAGPVPS